MLKYKYSDPGLLLVSVYMKYVFLSLQFQSVCVLKGEVSYRPCVVEVFIIIIDSAILSLSIGEFSLSSVQLLSCV